MPLVLLVVLATAHLEDLDLVVAAGETTVALTEAPATRGRRPSRLAFAYHEDFDRG